MAKRYSREYQETESKRDHRNQQGPLTNVGKLPKRDQRDSLAKRDQRETLTKHDQRETLAQKLNIGTIGTK